MDIKECEVILNRIYDETRSVFIRSEGHVSEGWKMYMEQVEESLGDVTLSSNYSQFLAMLAVNRGRIMMDSRKSDITPYERDWRLKAIDDIMFRLDIGE